LLFKKRDEEAVHVEKAMKFCRVRHGDVKYQIERGKRHSGPVRSSSKPKNSTGS